MLDISTLTGGDPLEIFNRTAVPYPSHACVHELVAEQVAATPDAVAVVSDEGSLTYAELDARAHRLGVQLRGLGVGPDVRVGVMLERSPRVMVALLAVLKAGGCYLPLDPSHPGERLAACCEDAQASVLISTAALAERLPRRPPALVDMDAHWGADGFLASVSGPDDLAYVCYTSGSTGRPKGVAVPHRAVVRLVRGADYASFEPGHVFLQLATLAFDASTFEIWGALANGATVAVMPPGTPTLDDLVAALRRHRVTTAFFTTGLFNVLVDERLDGLAGLQQVLFGGEACSRDHVRRAVTGLPGCRVVHVYGPTECTTFATAMHLTERDLELPSVPIGRPISNTCTYVLDERRRPVGIGVEGELWLGGDGLARGYLGLPELTAERFVVIPGLGRVYRTGDRARWLPDGTIEFLGRVDGQLKIRGFRVEPREVEERLSAHPDVMRCVAGGLDDPRGGRRLVAWVVPSPGAGAGLEQRLRDWMSAGLPEFMVPSAFVTVADLPLNASGKVDRAALPGPEEAVVTVHEQPVDTLETDLLALFEEVLKASGLGVHDRFFDHGGHSLLAVKLIARIEARLGVKLPLAVLFEAQTVTELAQRIRATRQAPAWSALVPLQPRGGRPPIFWVHSLGGDAGGGFLYYRRLAELLGEDQPSYGVRAPEEPHRRIEAMAGAYAAEVARFQPTGPILLGGFCFGGNVAYEMARQLTAEGREVPLVVLVESAPPVFGRGVGLADRLRVLMAAGGVEVTKRVGRRLWRRITSGKDDGVWSLIDRERYPKDYQTAAEAHWEALKHFRPRPWPGKAVLYRRPGIATACGWDRLARGGVTVVQVPGSHESVLEEPNVSLLAGHLRETLDALRA